MLMGTNFKIKVFSNVKDLTKDKFEKLAQDAFLVIERLENQMSTYRPDSPISKATKYAGVKSVPVTDDIINVLVIAKEVWKKTDGAFDVTFGPLGDVWDVKNRKNPPALDKIKKALDLVDFNNVSFDKEKRMLFLKKKGMKIGLGGLAKGYAAKKAGEVFKRAGYNDFIINAGGDLYVSGQKKMKNDTNKNNKFWTSGIKDPDSSSGFASVFKIMKDGAVVTSGDYERYFDYKGKRYHHVIDTKTGYPSHGVRSVTVFSKDPIVADAYATSFMIMGVPKSLEFVNARDDIACILIDNKGKVHQSKNLFKYIELF
jgi:thiamine biosynthesis lipoprotein